MLHFRWSLLAILLTVPLAHARRQADEGSAIAPFQMEQSTTTASLRGIHAVGGGVAWASGTDGTVLRTEDAGFEWQSCAMPPGAEKLDFRAVWGWDAQTAIVMSSGPGDQSRLYKTTDGCVSWRLLLTNQDKEGFWDALVFSDRKSGYLLGDPVNGRFVLKVTADGGQTWLAPAAAPVALPGAGAFAASNSSLALVPRENAARAPVRAFFGTGGGTAGSTSGGTAGSTSGGTAGSTSGGARVYEQGPSGWKAIAVPLAGSNADSGVFSLAFRNSSTGVAVGGDYQNPAKTDGTAAWTVDSGQHWTAASTPPHGYRSAVDWDEADKAWVCAGPNGSDYSRDHGRTWQPLDHLNWNAISLPWFVGPHGTIGKLVSLPQASQSK